MGEWLIILMLNITCMILYGLDAYNDIEKRDKCGFLIDVALCLLNLACIPYDLFRLCG